MSLSSPLADTSTTGEHPLRWSSVRPHLAPLFRLAWPVVLAEVGWMSMGVVDTLMVSPLGPDAIGAVGLGGSLFIAVAIFGMGLLLGLDTYVSQSFGAGHIAQCWRWLTSGLSLGAMVALPLTAALWAVAMHLDRLNLHPSVAVLTRPYLAILSWSLLPLLAYAACRRFLQGIGLVRPVTFALISANLVNAFANWVFIYGHLGVEPLGVAGSALATLAARIYMAAVLVWAIVFYADRPTAAQPDTQPRTQRLKQLFFMGAPAALQLVLEVGVFTAVTAMAARLNPIALASHQIALNIAASVFMIPLGTASAAAVLVGRHVGRRDIPGAVRAGWTALLGTSVVMVVVSLIFLAVPQLLIAGFTRDPRVVSIGVELLTVAALFQLCDGLQAVATGVLRGIGDTRTPMLWNLAGHWLGGLPAGWALCFIAGWGVTGLWVGLSIGLIAVGTALLVVWHYRARRLLQGGGSVVVAVSLSP
ncbi:MAG: MATE family efflux transporter [Vicinamibacterales bacterium]